MPALLHPKAWGRCQRCRPWDTQHWLLSHTLQPPSYDPAFLGRPTGVEPRLPKTQVARGWTGYPARCSRSTSDGPQGGDWCELCTARQVAPGVGPFQLPTGVSSSSSRGDRGTLPGSFSGALHLTSDQDHRSRREQHKRHRSVWANGGPGRTLAASLCGPSTRMLGPRTPGPLQALGQTDLVWDPDSLLTSCDLGQ